MKEGRGPIADEGKGGQSLGHPQASEAGCGCWQPEPTGQKHDVDAHEVACPQQLGWHGLQVC